MATQLKYYQRKGLFKGVPNRPLTEKQNYTKKYMVSAFIGIGYTYYKLYDVNGSDLTPIDEDRFSNIFGYDELMDIFTSEEIAKSKKKTYVDSYKVSYYFNRSQNN